MVLSRQRGTYLLGKTAAHLGAATPLALLVLQVLQRPESLGANPIAALTDQLGLWALRLLLLTLTITPLRLWTQHSAWLRYRRLLGLWAAAYAALHLLMYVAVDQRFAGSVLLEDVIKRPWITLGLATALLLLALSVTSTRAIMRRLGRRWQTLHYAIYPAAVGALWHYAWQVKKDLRAPLTYAALFVLLMALRLAKRSFRARFAPAITPGRT